MNVSVSKEGGKNMVNVTADIENTGKRDGDEVIELYVQDVKSSVERPEKELKGFKRIFIKNGEKKTVEFTLDDNAFAFWNENTKQWTVEPGEFVILLGSSSADIRLKQILNL